MISKIKAWLTSKPVRDRLYAAFKTFLAVFLSLFCVSLLGWLGDLQEWAGNGGDFPSISVLGKALVAAVAGGIAAVASWILNLLPFVKKPSYPPVPEPEPEPVPET